MAWLNPMFQVWLPILALSILTACAGRSTIAFLPEDIEPSGVETVLVASTRAIEDGAFSARRSETLNYMQFDVSVPPDRELGQIETVREHRPRIDPTRQFLVREATDIDDSTAFQAALNRALSDIPRGQAREATIFVHGFNNTFADGLYRTAQLQHDFNIPGAAIHYSWPSAGHVMGYAYDRDSALFARNGLEALMIDTAAGGSHDIVLVAHSLGSSLVMETLIRLRVARRQDILDRISGVILLSPDIDITVFRSQALRIAPLPQPFVIFTSRSDRALLLSAGITGRNDRLGNIDDIEELADLDVTLVDVSGFSGTDNDRLNHFTAVASPAVVEIINRVDEVANALEGGVERRVGLLPGTILTVQNATQVILTPVAATP
ncbi:MAG: alpha/beta fold hydrolase [Pseudomonadota bacterium]